MTKPHNDSKFPATDESYNVLRYIRQAGQPDKRIPHIKKINGMERPIYDKDSEWPLGHILDVVLLVILDKPDSEQWKHNFTLMTKYLAMEHPTISNMLMEKLRSQS